MGIKQLLFVFTALLIGCAGPSINDYSTTEPTLNIESFFDGQLQVYGIVRNRQGKLIRHFEAQIAAHWDKGIGTLDETFLFNDGEKQTRIWTLKPNKQKGHFLGYADDVVGAAKIRVSGQAMNIRYYLSVPWGDDSSIDIAMDDWLFKVAPGVIMNETMMTKWGIHVGTVTLVIMKVP